MNKLVHGRQANLNYRLSEKKCPFVALSVDTRIKLTLLYDVFFSMFIIIKNFFYCYLHFVLSELV